MATKTVINCTEHSIMPLNQGISIIIDDQQPSESKSNHTDFEYSPHSTNIIKIQHSSASTFQQSSPQLLTLSSSSTTLLNNNKTLIDINRNNDPLAKDPLNDHVLQINCTTSNEIFKEIHLTKENSNIKLESNGFSELGIQNGIENEHNNHLEHNEEENVIGKEIVNDDDRDDDEEKEFTKYNQHNFNSPEEVVEESGQTTSQQQKPPQHQQVNNGNSKYRENGQNSSTKYEHNQQHNNEDHSNNNHDHNHDLDHNEVTSLGDDQVNISADTLKRVMMVGSSHGKRSFSEENSNSLLTKADATTTSATTTLTINELIENHTNTKQNLENLKENHNHVVKIQIKPNELKTEKQVTVVKIENPQKPQEYQEKVKKENLEIQENIPSIEIKQEESVKITEKMVQKPSNNSTQTVTVSNNTHSSSTTGNATVSNTGATTVTELNVSNPNYLYYMMSSGQFSPCDTLDSGTGSDLESNGQSQQQQPSQQQQSSANLSTKKSSNSPSIKPLEMHIKTTKIRVANSSKSKESQQRQCSFTDSEESEASSLSCDSLHSNEFLRQQSASPMESPNTNNKKIQSFLPDSLLREIKNLKFSSTDYEAENEEEDDILPQLNKSKPKSSSSLYESDNHYEPINTQDYQQSDYVKTRNSINNCSMSSSLKRASLPSKTFVINQEDGTFIDTKMNSMPRKYEADKYYNFHVNEHDNFRSFGNNSSSSLSSPNGDGDSFSISDFDTKSLHDDVFAGYKDIRCSSNTSTIRSSKGTVRGVKNRVRNGIATFLQLQQPNVKNFKEKDSGKVVLYTTSMGIIRDTYAKCSNVKQILRTLLVKFEERDVFMSVEYQQEIKERMHSEIIKVPQLYVEGQHIGDADTVERLNESGELRQLLKPYKSISTTYTCQTCGGYRLLPCPSCNGSKKSVHRNHFTAEFVALKCMNCDEVGLVKCHNC